MIDLIHRHNLGDCPRCPNSKLIQGAEANELTCPNCKTTWQKIKSKNLIDEAQYRSYVYNRSQAPSIEPKGWKSVFGEDVDKFEERYQFEQIINDSLRGSK